MDGTARVYIEKDQKRTEVLVEMTVKVGRPRYWLKEKKAQNQEEQQREPQKDDSTTEEDPVTEEDPAMQEVSLDDRQDVEITALQEKVASWRRKTAN